MNVDNLMFSFGNIFNYSTQIINDQWPIKINIKLIMENK